MLNEQEVRQALLLAKKLQAAVLADKASQTFGKRLRPLLENPHDKPFLIHLLDVAFRSNSYQATANFVRKLLAQHQESWHIFSGLEQQMMKLFQWIGYRFSGISIPFMQLKISQITQSVVFVKDSSSFAKLNKTRTAEDIRLNINLIGEALLGEEEALHRLDNYKKLLDSSDINYVSVKISTIYSQIDSLAYEATLNDLEVRLTELYDKLMEVHAKTGIWKFINLDMEEYRDLSLTVDVFMRTLSKPQFKNLRAGIVLQAYIPDTYHYLEILQDFAKQRVAAGGAPIKIRIVKGANMEMEKVESSLFGWELVTYSEKIESDANYKKMLHKTLTQESCESVHIGVASHNVFDLAYAISLVKANKLEKCVDFEMLEGMAGPLSQAILKEGVQVILYTPLVDKDNFMSAIAYLVRRLDEGTANGNFLKEGFELDPTSNKWNDLEGQFLNSLALASTVSNEQNRKQNRLEETFVIPQKGFDNVADTDWVLAPNREWANNIVATWEDTTQILGKSVVPVSIEKANRQTIEQENFKGMMPWKYELAEADDYQYVLDVAHASSWHGKTVEERATLLKNAALCMQKRRADLIGVGMAEVGKLIKELDPEVSEAIDFANYYAESALQWTAEPNLSYQKGGVNLVLPPWNFPIAIAAGGVLASLAAGNVVILKPSMNAAACAYVMCECLWEGGIPKDALYFLPADESSLDKFLSEGNVFDAVILTGSTQTAQFLLQRNPDLHLFAETGGKNVTIVTALADREQAVKNIVQSAFGNAGQKCSATSLLILEKEVFEDPYFKNLLVDTVTSKKIGTPWDLKASVSSLSVPPNERLQEVITQYADKWLIKPTIDGYTMTLGVLWGIDINDPIYTQELFGPVLAVMQASDLTHALQLANGTPYGLTSGLESLDEEEIAYWKATMKAGNLYINRSTTGAIVQRQPFGGIKASCFGEGMKAGGPNYVAQFLKPKVNLTNSTVGSFGKWDKIASVLSPEDKQAFSFALTNIPKAFEKTFEEEVDFAHIRGQYNLFRYLLPTKIVCTVDETTPAVDIALVALVAETLSVALELVSDKALANKALWESVGIKVKTLASWNDLADQWSHEIVYRVLNYDTLPSDLIKNAHQHAIHLYSDTPLAVGRIELLNYVTEQSISHNYHRYGNLMGKEVM
ncbi:MAG: proline dehydrogenase family protein [Spirosomataceae bacterium]